MSIFGAEVIGTAILSLLGDGVANIITEVIGTMMLVLGVLASVATGAGGPVPLLVGLLVLAIGLSLGGPTGYAINPARDLGPRIM